MSQILSKIISSKTIFQQKHISEVLLSLFEKHLIKCFVTYEVSTQPKYNIVSAKKADYEKIMKLLYEHFFFDEPLIKSHNLPKRSINTLMEEAYNDLKNDKSFISVTENGEIIGASINRQLNEWDVDTDLKLIATLNCRKLRQLLHFWHRLTVESNLFRKHNIKDVFEVSYLVTHAKYRGYGIASKLLDASRDFSKQNGNYMIRIDATNNFTAVMCSKCKMNIEYEIRYENFKSYYGKYSLTVPKPHTSARVYSETNNVKPPKKENPDKYFNLV